MRSAMTTTRTTIIGAVAVLGLLAGLIASPQLRHAFGPDCTQYQAGATADAMNQAVRANDIDAVRCILDGGFDVNAIVQSDRVALDLAASHGRLELVAFLLDRGAVVNVTERPTISRALTGLGLDYEASTDPDEDMISSLEEHYRVIELLLENGSRLDELHTEEVTIYISLILNYCDVEVADRATYTAFLDRLERMKLPQIKPDKRTRVIIGYLWGYVGLDLMDGSCLQRSMNAFPISFDQGANVDE